MFEANNIVAEFTARTKQHRQHPGDYLWVQLNGVVNPYQGARRFSCREAPRSMDLVRILRECPTDLDKPTVELIVFNDVYGHGDKFTWLAKVTYRDGSGIIHKAQSECKEGIGVLTSHILEEINQLPDPLHINVGCYYYGRANGSPDEVSGSRESANFDKWGDIY